MTTPLMDSHISFTAIPWYCYLVAGFYSAIHLCYEVNVAVNKERATMPQFNAVVLKDNSGTDHSFTPDNITGGVATLVNTTGVPLANRTVSIARSRTATGRQKVTMKMVLPVVQDAIVNGISKPSVVRTAYADVTFTFDGSSSTAERADARAFLESFLGNESLVGSIIADLSSPY